MVQKYFFITSTIIGALLANLAEAQVWPAASISVEVRRDNIHGQHLYITRELGEGEMGWKMSRESLPNNWKVTGAKAVNSGLVLEVEGKEKMCFSPKTLGRVQFEILDGAKKLSDVGMASIWEKHQIECEEKT